MTLLAGGATFVGCATPSDSGATATTVPQTENAAAAAEAAAKLHAGKGPMVAFHVALKELDLSAAQRATVQGVIDGLHSAQREQSGRPAVLTDLAAAVRAGTIDEAALQPKLDALATERANRPAKMAAAFQTLHDTLTADQRTKLVATLRARMAAYDQKRQERAEARGADTARPFLPFMHGIDLTADQQARVEQALADAGLDKGGGKARFEQRHTRMRLALDAFAAAEFDATTFIPPTATGRGDHLEHMVKVLAVVTPLLDQAQRATLADNLEKGSIGRHRKHGGALPDAQAPAVGLAEAMVRPRKCAYDGAAQLANCWRLPSRAASNVRAIALIARARCPAS